MKAQFSREMRPNSSTGCGLGLVQTSPNRSAETPEKAFWRLSKTKKTIISNK
jgi:hypothetical protein